MEALDEQAPGRREASAGLTFLLAASCGLLAANIYYPQPLAGPIGAALGLPASATGLVVTLTQLGYGIGLLLVVPLGDLVENRKLIATLTGLAMLALLGAGLSTQPATFLTAAFLVGLGSVAIQVLVPYAAHLASDALRGRIVGNVMSGLMLGIMLARPVASLVAEFSSWHMVFFASAAVMAVLAVVIVRGLPKRVPASRFGYGTLLASMAHLLLTERILQRRAFYHFCLFGAFSLFWTTTPLLLAGPAFGLSQGGIALFALAGVAGAIAAPIAGRVADHGWTKPATAFAMVAAGAAFLITHIAPAGSGLALGLLVVAAILLDFGVSGHIVLAQRAIFMLGAQYRGRLNGLFMSIFYSGGAVGSAVGGWAYAQGGWPLASWIGFAFPVVALICFATE